MTLLGRVGTLTSEYVTYGAVAHAQVSRLDTIARLELGAALERALAGTLGDDETVYVLRDVQTEFVLRVDEADAARRWAEALAKAIIEAVADDDGDSAGLVKFADEATYFACYLADHVRGEAGTHWYFGALRRFHDLPATDVLSELLTDVRLDLVFAALHRQGNLEDVLAAVPADVLLALTVPYRLSLVASGLPGNAGDQGDDLPGLWPLLVAATRIADDWTLWTSAPLTPPEVARRYQPRPVPDWRDPASLTAIVLDVLRTLPEIGRPAGPAPSSLVSGFDWLDLPLLVQGLTGDPIARRPAPRETTILAEVRAAADRLAGVGSDPAAVIRLRAAIFADHPEWTDDPLVESVLAAVVTEAVADFDHSECAGVLLLLRGVSDARLPAVLARAGVADALTPALLAVAGHLTGADSTDPAVLAFAGRPGDLDAEIPRWAGIEAAHGPAIRRELDSVLRGLKIDLPGDEGAEATPRLGDGLANVLAQAVLAAWSRWLGPCAGLAVPDLLAHFVRRRGRLSWKPRELRVELEASLLDVALRQAGYDQPIESVPWLGDRRVSFRTRAVSDPGRVR